MTGWRPTRGAKPGIRIGADALLVTLYYGLRKGETLCLTWDDLREAVPGSGVWTLTIGDTKNGRPLVLPVTRMVAVVLSRRRMESHGSPWIFPTGNIKPSKSGRLTEVRGVLKVVCEQARCGNLMPHDLRRTFASVAAASVPHAVLKGILNHASSTGDVTMTHYVRLSAAQLKPHLEHVSDLMNGSSAAPAVTTPVAPVIPTPATTIPRPARRPAARLMRRKVARR